MQPAAEDLKYWQEAVREVKQHQTAPIVPELPKLLPLRWHEHVFYAVKQDFSICSKDIDAPDFSGGIDKNTLRKFKREEFAIEATLDLHGKTEAVAFAAVDDFVARSYTAGKRCIVIITGKCLNVHTDDYDVLASRGVLKKLVPEWLNLPHLKAMILSYKHPSARLGGSGALYILLRRQR